MSGFGTHFADHVEEVDIAIDGKHGLRLNFSTCWHIQQGIIFVFEHVLDILVLLFVELTLAAITTCAPTLFSEILLASFIEQSSLFVVIDILYVKFNIQPTIGVTAFLKTLFASEGRLSSSSARTIYSIHIRALSEQDVLAN